MKRESEQVVFTQMKPRERGEWKGVTTTRKTDTKRRLRNISFSAAAILCVGGAVGSYMIKGGSVQAVLSNHVTAEFDYDETLGRLQFVSNILPESAMVFLESTTEDTASVFAPVSTEEVVHAWSESEPWLEYACTGDVKACRDGEVMTVVKNREDEYTVRLLHEDGYESIYSGLTHVNLMENEQVLSGDALGQANGLAAFELRKDGLSILPVFEAR